MTSQLTANYFTTELLGTVRLDIIDFNPRSQSMTNMSMKFPELQVLCYISD